MKYKIEFRTQPAGYQQVNLLTKSGHLVWSTLIYPVVTEPPSEEAQKDLVIADIKSEIATYDKLIKKFNRILKGMEAE